MTLALIALIAAAAFTAEGAIGFGATVIMVSIGAQLLPLDVLLPAWVPLNLVMSAFLVARNHRHIAWRFLLVEILPIVALGTAIGLALFHIPDKSMYAALLGGFVSVLALLQLLRAGRSTPLSKPWQAAFLAVGGVAHGLFGSGGPMIVYVARRKLADAAAFRASLCLLWLLLNISLVVNYLALGLFTQTTGSYSLVIAAVLVPGIWFGNKLHYALPPALFERCVWIGLLIAGLALNLRYLLD